MIKPLHFWIEGRMPNKKNEITISRRGHKLFIDHTPRWKAYETESVFKLKRAWQDLGKPLDYQVEIQAVELTALYWPPDRTRVDLTAMLETVADLLEKATVIWNDKQILSPGISRLMEPDSESPGVFIRVAPYQPAQGEFYLKARKANKRARRKR